MSISILAVLPTLALAASSAMSATVDFSEARGVNLSLSSFKFAPSALHLKAGEPVILRLINESRQAHDVTAPEFFAAAQIRPADAQFIRGGRIELRGGQAVLIGLVPREGRYALKCGHPLHKTLGMSGTITVNW